MDESRIFLINVNGSRVYAVRIVSTLLHGTYFFSDLDTAKKHLEKETENLKKYGVRIRYNRKMELPEVWKREFSNSVGMFSNIHTRQIFKF